MWIEGPVDVRGVSTYVLRFDSKIALRSLLRSAAAHRGSTRCGARRSASSNTSGIRSPVMRICRLLPDEKRLESAKGETGQSRATYLDEHLLCIHPHLQ